MASSPNPWPAISASEVMPPIAVFRQIASMLGDQTLNVVEAAVRSEVAGAMDGEVVLRMRVIAPLLNFYELNVIEARHALLAVYPCRVKLTLVPNPKVCTAKDEEELRQTMTGMLADESVKALLFALYSQSVEARAVAE